MRNKEEFSWIICILLIECALSEDTCGRSTCLGQLSFGEILPRSAFITRYRISLYQCATECRLRRQRCKSFNYRRSFLSCQLCEHDSGPDRIYLQPEAGAVHSNIDTWKIIRIGNCNAINCSWTQRCDSSKLDDHTACVPTVCKTPLANPGTIENNTEVEVGQNYTYICQNGLFGKSDQNQTVTCLPNGSWTSTNFSCVCTTLPAKSGAINETAEVEVGQNYTYRCQGGLFGKRDQNPTVTCLQDGNWTSTNFTCVCKTPPAIPETINETVEAEVGQNYTYRCQNGLFGKRDQNPKVKCLRDGNWTTTNFTCVCKTPPAIPETINETVEAEVGQNYTYRCQNGLFGKRDQNPKVKCLRDGNWTTTNFTCVCKTPPAIPETINETVEAEVGQNYTYRCQNGLFGKRDQNPKVKCLRDGNWTTTNFTCVCNTPPAIRGAINETSEVEVGQNYTYRCQGGLFEKGAQNPTVTCRHDGSWTSTNFICVKQNWKQDTIYPNNIHKSDVINTMTGIDLLTCMQQCDDKLDNCLSFFYENHTSHCVLSTSFRRGLPQNFNFSDGIVYYTAPSASCDMEYSNVSLGGSYFCIKLHQIDKNFNEAMKLCESEKAKLLVITTKAQVAAAKMFFKGVFGWGSFLGMSDEANEGRWVSWDGKAVSPEWNLGEPSSPAEDCAYIHFQYDGVFAFGCNKPLLVLCHKKQL